MHGTRWRGQGGGQCGRSRFSRGGRSWLSLWRCAQIQARGAELLLHLGVTAKRTADQATGVLALKVVLRREPAFKDMMLRALEV